MPPERSGGPGRFRGWALVVLALGLACTPATSSRDSPERPAGPPRAGGAVPVSADAVSKPLVRPAAVRRSFAGRISVLPAPLRRRMSGTTWKPGCPVPLRDLRLLEFNYWGFDGAVRRGPMVVHEDVAEDVLWVFGRLFRARFPVKRVALAQEFVPEEFEEEISTRRSVTAAFNCRPVLTPRGPGEGFSRHAYGLAVDINPVENPYVTADGFVRNRMSRPYVDRTRRRKGMIHDGDVVVRSFAAMGWEWGGHWQGGKDYMHFSLARG